MNTIQNKCSEDALLAAYKKVRRSTEELCQHLEIEDYGLQAMPEVSPPKWHLAHTSWFFETFILKPFANNHQAFHKDYEYLFNSYYHGIGKQYPRNQRTLLSRPTVKEVFAFRQHIDEAMADILTQTEHPQRSEILQRCELGLHHEQQHQELLCTDIKYSFFFNPLFPAIKSPPTTPKETKISALNFLNFNAGDTHIGFLEQGFHFDNESPAHQSHVPAFKMANRLITNAEYLEFICDSGYKRPELWLSDGWVWKETNNITQPLYWVKKENIWYEYTLYGLLPLDLSLPVNHINYYEADACARWFNKRLLREDEWETACRQLMTTPNQRHALLHPERDSSNDVCIQMFGSLWQWTQSNYAAYPGYRQAEGAIGEYNGKFMCNQIVLRGSSCVTPPGHARISYRNFFYPKDRWQFTGIRLADDS